jgi:imidazoleglycerol phosphate dehydratase HisB
MHIYIIVYKEKDLPVSLDEIKAKLNLDISARPDILHQVSNNDRIQCSLPFLQYKVIFQRI